MSLGDPRVAEWPMMQSPWPALATCLVYTLMANLGPRLINGKTPQALPLKGAVLAYNFVIVAINLHIVTELCITTRHYRWRCQPLELEGEYPMRTAKAIWWFFIVKFVELL